MKTKNKKQPISKFENSKLDNSNKVKGGTSQAAGGGVYMSGNDQSSR